jgi:hypothetical protein
VFSRFEAEFDQTVDGLVAKFGILSLTEDPLNQLMWTHYAASGGGFVVGFDAQHDFFQSKDAKAKTSLLRKVLYTDERIDNFWRNPYYLFLVKHSGWGYEREWRMLKNLVDCDERSPGAGSSVFLCNLQPGLIKRVYFGYGYNRSFIPHDISAMKGFGSDPELFDVQINRGAGTLEPVRI